MNTNTLISAILLFPAVAMVGITDETPEKVKTPAEIISPSSAGEVVFPHQFHFEELEVECSDCHHETNAAKLQLPHDNYFDDFWIDCKICHHDSEVTGQVAQACSACHHDSPVNIADETLSSKVVIHQNCWGCHEVEKGAEASRSCALCHSGPKTQLDIK